MKGLEFTEQQKKEMSRGLSERGRNISYLSLHKEELRNMYPDMTVAIYQENVVGAGMNYASLIKRLRQTYTEDQICLMYIDTTKIYKKILVKAGQPDAAD